jgi:inner membrane transporter RhtA
MISIQSGASLAKQLFPAVGAPGATALRLSFAALILCAVWRPWRYPLSRYGWRMIALYGSTLGIMNLLFYLALDRIPLGIAVALEFTGPLALALILSRKAVDFIWAILAIVGIVLIFPQVRSGAAIDIVGALFALGAGGCWALYIVFGQRAGTAIPSGITAALGMAIAACVTVPISGVLILSNGTFHLTAAIIGVALIVAVLSSALPYTLEMVALKRIPAKTFSILMSVEPAIAALSGWVFLRERLIGAQWLAIFCIMFASFGSALSARTPVLATEPEV